VFESPPQYLNRWEVPRGCGVRVDNATGRPLGLAGREGVALKPFLCLSEDAAFDGCASAFAL
jgi:hypothetical protein